MNFNDFCANIKTVDAQESLNGGLIVFVTGDLTRNDMVKDFTQSFFLAPQDNGYFILNDLFRFFARGSSDTSEQSTSTRLQPLAEVAGIGNTFVQLFYWLLHQSPQTMYHFYKECSRLGRPDPSGAMYSVTTMQAIKEKFLATDYREFRAEIKTVEIKTVDTQESFSGGLIVLVTGSLTGEHSVRNFTQSFFLAPQNKDYFVLNDIFRYKHKDDHQLESDGLANELLEQMTLNEHNNPLHLNLNSSATSATIQHPPAADEDAELTEAISASIQSAIAEGILAPEPQNNSGVSEQGGGGSSSSSSSSNSSSSSRNNDSKSCVICLDAPMEGACIPCGHMSGCMPCLNQIKGASGCCPVCRAKIDQVYIIYVVSG